MKRLLLILFAALVLPMFLLTACSPKESEKSDADTPSKAVESVAPTIDDEGELPINLAPTVEKKSSASQKEDSASSAVSDPADDQGGVKTPSGSSDSDENSTDKSSQNNSGGKDSGGQSSSNSSGNNAGGNSKSAPTTTSSATDAPLPESVSEYVEENGYELPFVPKK